MFYNIDDRVYGSKLRFTAVSFIKSSTVASSFWCIHVNTLLYNSTYPRWQISYFSQPKISFLQIKMQQSISMPSAAIFIVMLPCCHQLLSTESWWPLITWTQFTQHKVNVELKLPVIPPSPKCRLKRAHLSSWLKHAWLKVVISK